MVSRIAHIAELRHNSEMEVRQQKDIDFCYEHFERTIRVKKNPLDKNERIFAFPRRIIGY
jgi:hypothetical protein